VFDRNQLQCYRHATVWPQLERRGNCVQRTSNILTVFSFLLASLLYCNCPLMMVRSAVLLITLMPDLTGSHGSCWEVCSNRLSR